MARKAKKTAKKSAKKATKKAGTRKSAGRTPARKAAKRTASKKTAKKSAKRAAPARGNTARKNTAARKTTAKKAAGRKGDVKGEGNYSASRRFRKKEEGFIARMRNKIPGLAKNAETALEGSEGRELQAAEAETRARGEGMDVEKE